jgi:hypothetical protein
VLIIIVAALTAAVVRLEKRRHTNIIGSCTEFMRCFVGWVNDKHDQTSLAFALVLPFGASANVLFVSPKGSDRGQCNSVKKPVRHDWSSVQRGQQWR